jgi:hypothetical protein
MPSPGALPQTIYYAHEVSPGVMQAAATTIPPGAPEPPLPDGWVEISAEQYDFIHANPGGWGVADGALASGVAPPPAPPPRLTITPRQLLIGLQRAGMITDEEALAAAATGAVPASIETLFAALSEQDALEARITWARMTVVERGHPLVDEMLVAAGKTAEEADEFFVACAAI